MYPDMERMDIRAYNRNQILVGHVLDELRKLPDESVQMVVTSPPFYALRDYSLPDVEWSDGWRGSFGLEPTPDLYIAHTVEICREIRRVLRGDGTLWWNLADSYATTPPGNKPSWETSGLHGARTSQKYQQTLERSVQQKRRSIPPSLKPKDLCLIPSRVALALQADGWYIRSLIVWAKPNPMPESCTDRPTKSYEHIIFASKSRNYFFDAEAVREKATYEGDCRGKRGDSRRGSECNAMYSESVTTGRNLRDVWTMTTSGFSYEFCAACKTPYSRGEYQALRMQDGKRVCRCGASDRWVSHFATFPEELPLRCIKAGTSEWGQCPKCGKPWGRDVEKEYDQHRQAGQWCERGQNTNGMARSPAMYEHGSATKITTTLGWSPRCKCEAGDPIPQVVLDPFLGSGKTAIAARKLNRDFIGVELNEDYAEMARQIIERETGGLFAAESATNAAEKATKEEPQ